ncbi:hypothetical protein [Acidithiobacillus sp. HP-11]|uniref:hypothetical protein n=1 Tax=Acidithiobacillus sp. HP-11 TaxID=2697656 RepID=UPI001879C63A|nr:hypothetical protein [Acidithiobacillus sp. HP-11]MBE7566676.1 hypothetical protein [Acidithiobacillus sp. HP-11]
MSNHSGKGCQTKPLQQVAHNLLSDKYQQETLTQHFCALKTEQQKNGQPTDAI